MAFLKALSRWHFSYLSAHFFASKVFPTKAARSYSAFGLRGSMLTLLVSKRLEI